MFCGVLVSIHSVLLSTYDIKQNGWSAPGVYRAARELRHLNQACRMCAVQTDEEVSAPFCICGVHCCSAQ